MQNGNIKMLARAPRLGARLGTSVEGCKVYVSTVLYGRERFTRVEADECETLHYAGDLDTDAAARGYFFGAPSIESQCA
jgi:hypothetical protein